MTALDFRFALGLVHLVHHLAPAAVVHVDVVGLAGNDVQHNAIFLAMSVAKYGFRQKQNINRRV